MVARVIAVEPFDLVVFGASGDLAARKLIPALYFRDVAGQIPPQARIVGASRRHLSGNEFRDLARGWLEEHVRPEEREDGKVARFLGRLAYVAVQADGADGWNDLAGALADAPERVRVFYLATAPELFGPICANIGRHGLASKQARVVVEKPIGKSLASASEVNDAIGAVFPEERVYRIDHSLGKETVQNLMALRFANALFEPVWNSAHIDHVQITVAETLGVEGRAGYYDTAGALRDMVQNHMLQLLCLVAMEPPTSLEADAVRDEKLKVLKSLVPMTADTVAERSVRGQYRAGASSGGPVKGYLEEPHRDVRGAAGGDRQLALGGRAVLPAQRQTAGEPGVGDRGGVPADPAFGVLRRRADFAEPAGDPPAAERGREAVADDQGSRPRRHAAATRAAGHELRQRVRGAQPGRL
jgi:glucose-6-phosphate 1-dehydrogenase